MYPSFFDAYPTRWPRTFLEVNVHNKAAPDVHANIFKQLWGLPIEVEQMFLELARRPGDSNNLLPTERKATGIIARFLLGGGPPSFRAFNQTHCDTELRNLPTSPSHVCRRASLCCHPTGSLLAHPDWSEASTIGSVKAYDPSSGMRTVFAEKTKVTIAEGTFDSVDAEDNWADLVVVAQVSLF